MLRAVGKENSRCCLEDIMPLKESLEVWYIRNRSPWTDLKIIAATCTTIVLPNARFFVTWFAEVEPLLRASSLHR